MSLEAALTENTKATNNLAAILQEIARGPGLVSAVPPSAEPTEQKQVGAEPVEVTPAELRKQFMVLIPELVKASKKPQVLAVLEKYGAKQVPQIKDADLAAAFADLKAL